MSPRNKRLRPRHFGCGLVTSVDLVASVIAASVMMSGDFASAQGQGARSRQEEARRKLLEQVGLEKSQAQKPPPAPPAADEAPADPAPSPTAPDAGAGAPSGTPAAPLPPKPGFSRVHQALLGACRTCHVAGGMAGTTRLVLGGGAAADHAATRAFVDLAAPRRSLLLTKGTGVQHAGGATIPTGGEVYRRILAWIAAGALLNPSAGTAAPAPAVAPPTPARPRRPRPATAAAPLVATTPPTTAVPATPTPGEPAPTTEAAAAAAPSTEAASPESTTNPTAAALHAEIVRACLACHRAGAPAGATRYKLTGTAADDIAISRAFVDATKSPASPLVTKAAGEMHGGGPIWPKDSPGHQTLLAWLAAGAPELVSQPSPTTAAATEAPAAAPAPPTAAPPVATPAAAPTPGFSPVSGHGAAARGIGLGHDITLNGRFDLNLERRGFSGNPWNDGAKTALQSHHHFLFLSRQSADDPFVFTAELTSLAFYEAAIRVGPRDPKAEVHLRAGKLLVPFGIEPLFHQSYGGHVGFDQKVLPAVWASEGAAVTAHREVRGVTLRGDLYSVRGHALRRADAVLNLQSDLSAVDDAKLAVGGRLNLAVGPLAAYYSAYFNPLGHDRRLLVQAIDLTLWRWREIPVLDRLVLGGGLLRADISGGGAGADSYHFASYWLARAYATRWLWLQYRQGLRTFDNKRNLTYDGRRRGPEDGSTHNFTIAARYRGFSVYLSHYINFEKADEVTDDLSRLGVVYEF